MFAVFRKSCVLLLQSPDNYWRLCSTLKRYGHMYTLTIIYMDGSTKQRREQSLEKYVPYSACLFCVKRIITGSVSAILKPTILCISVGANFQFKVIGFCCLAIIFFVTFVVLVKYNRA